MSQSSTLLDTRHESPKVVTCQTKLMFDSDEDSETLSLPSDKDAGATLKTRLFGEDEDSRDSGVGNEIEDGIFFDLPERSFSILTDDNKLVTKEDSLPTISTQSLRVEDQQHKPQCFRQKRDRVDECSPLRQKRRRKTLRHNASMSSDSPIREDKYQQNILRNDSGSEDESLTGDKVEKLRLPTIAGKHRDLNSVTPDTLARVLNGEFSKVVDEAVIVDCRYPYEYEGGHIKGAINIFTKETLLERFMENVEDADLPDKRTILIFHCEFSSERAPKMCRFLRQTDRQANSEHYPKLHYPELYLLDGGYKNFFENKKELCTPPSYLPMNHKEHKEDMRKFRIKSKSWAGDKKSRSVFGF